MYSISTKEFGKFPCSPLCRCLVCKGRQVLERCASVRRGLHLFTYIPTEFYTRNNLHHVDPQRSGVRRARTQKESDSRNHSEGGSQSVLDGVSCLSHGILNVVHRARDRLCHTFNYFVLVSCCEFLWDRFDVNDVLSSFVPSHMFCVVSIARCLPTGAHHC